MINALEINKTHDIIVIANMITVVAETLVRLNLKEVQASGGTPITMAEAKLLAFKSINKRIKGGAGYVVY